MSNSYKKTSNSTFNKAVTINNLDLEKNIRMKFHLSFFKNAILLGVLFTALSLSANAQTSYPDEDGDGYGNNAIPCYAGGDCGSGIPHVLDHTDCNDNDANIHPWTWYIDADGDGWYGSTTINCYSPGAGWTKSFNMGADCDDNNALYHLRYWYLDVDLDGYATAEQWTCTPPNANWHCNGQAISGGRTYFRISSTDCDDNDASKNTTMTVYIDNDGDGHISNTTPTTICGNGVPVGYTLSTLPDCDDNNAAVWQTGSFMQDHDGDWYLVGPVTVQYGNTVPAGYLPLNSNSNGVDCDDNSFQLKVSVACYVDADEDNFAADNVIVYACGGSAAYPVAPPGHVLLDDSFGIDCDDNNPNAFAVKTAYKDNDGDGFVVNQSLQICDNAVPAGYTIYVSGWDCDDNNPNAQQIQTLYTDADGDGYTAGSTSGCGLAGVPAGYSSFSYGTDYNDNDATIYRAGSFYKDTDHDSYPQSLTVYTIGYGQTIPTGYMNISAYSTNVDCDDNNASIGPGAAYYIDSDHDGIGSATRTVICPFVSTPPTGYSTSNNDCDDNNASIGSYVEWYIDLDNDGYYGGTITYGGCNRPTGGKIQAELTSSYETDCNDNNPVINPSNVWYQDLDNDGYSSGITFSGNPGCSLSGYKRADQLTGLSGDCNDNNASFNPGAATAVWYQDADGDGYGNPSVSLTQCPKPNGYVANNTDCNDGNAQINPATIWYQDVDNDGVSSGATLTQCATPANYKLFSQLTVGTDCDDNNAGTGSACATGTSGGPYWVRDTDGDRWPDNPVSFSIDGVNTIGGTCAPNCNWVCVFCYNTSRSSLAPVSGYDCSPNDPNVQTVVTLYADADNDGYTSGATTTACNNTVVAGYKAPGQLLSGTDCNDNNASITIGSVSGNTYYQDSDNDGFGNASVSYKDCTQPTGYVTNNTDCNDANAAINANTVWYKDIDNDGYSDGITQTACTAPVNFKAPANLIATSGDCNDTLASINPTSVWYKDADGDGYSDGTTDTACAQPVGYYKASALTSLAGDCNDNDATLKIGVTYFKDVDNDLYSDGDSIVQCGAPTNYKLAANLYSTSGDCNDNDAAIHPGSLVGVLKWFIDVDNDGYGNINIFQFSCAQPVGFVADSTDCSDGDDEAYPNALWYKDADHDGYSDGLFISQCTRPTGTVYGRSANEFELSTRLISTSGDCNDNNPLEHANAIWFKDADNDKYGDGTSIIQCSQPVGYNSELAMIDTIGDCDDSNALAQPNVLWAKDADNDGFTDGTYMTQCLQPAGFVPYSQVNAVDSVITGNPPSLGAALNFSEAGGNFVDIPHNSSLNVQNEFTIEAWINPADAANNTIIDKGDYRYLLSHNPNGTTGLGFYRSGTWVYNTMNIPVGTWSHIAVTYSVTANEIKFYLNGMPSGTTLSGAVSDAGDNGNVNIGRQSPSSCACNPFNGTMDDFRIWNTIRTAAQIHNNYNKEIPTTASGLVVNYHFNQGVAGGDNTGFTNVIDASGSNNNGTLAGFTRNGNTSNWVSPGAVNNYTISVSNLDCNDSDSLINPASIWYLDYDADNLGNPLFDSVSCSMPTGYVLNNFDQNDSVSNAGAPNIIVRGNNNLILNQDTIPSYTDSTDFGNICIGTYDVIKTFTFQNNGTANLLLYSTAIYGLNAGSYLILDTVRVVPANASVNIRVAFNSATVGQRDAFFIAESDDATDNVYLFKITANIVALPTVTLALADACNNTNAVQLSGGSPLNGTYSGTGVVSNIFYPVNGTQNITYMFTDSNGCSASAQAQQIVNPPVDNTTVLNGVTLSANESVATYQWLDCNNGNAIIAGETSQAFTPSATGNYAVIITQGTCSDTSACINVLPTSINNKTTANDISVYPNPNNGNFVITASDAISSIEIFDMVGKLVFVINPNATVTAVSLKEYAEGVYLVKINSKGKQIIKRVVVN